MKSSDRYDHRAVEAAWRQRWEADKIYQTDLQNPKLPFYNLMMFPYPSAEGLHVGNMYAFAGSDIYGRLKRMQGYDVFEPIGLDGFGIHSENYALKVGRHPMEHARITEKNFYNQLHKIGAMYDWSRTVETYNQDYYKWTQWLFVQMYKRGLAYRAKSEVNWCPSCKTVLADEQVIDGKCERCGNAVIKKLLEQWFFRITAYAEKLLQNTYSLNWSEKVLIAQRNWIGKKEGMNITYEVVDEAGMRVGEVTCFTTRPDTNFGLTFVALSPEHPFISRLLEVSNQKKVESITKYIDQAKNIKKEDRIAQGRKKTGVFTGLYVINNLNSYKMPLYISDFVLMEFGTGALVGVPGHDKRDFEFAQAMKLPILRVVVGPDGDRSEIRTVDQVQEEEGVMINSSFLDGVEIHEAIEKMMDHLEKRGWGKRVVTYHLRDWLISRQRYWGPPIPMINCPKCGWQPVPEKDLPVVLPQIEDYQPKGTGVAPLATHKEFYEVDCPSCGNIARRETDVSDTFLDSSWYFLRYPTVGVANADKVPFDKAITKKWLPVDMYTGGAEHSVLHLMYSRFITMALHDWNYLDFEEPFPNFYAHGLIIKDGAKMSKSKGNIVNPDQYIELYGADALRIYLMFTGPFDQGGDFRDSAMEGMSRWVRKVWRMALFAIDKQSNASSANVQTALQVVIKKVGSDIEKRRYNTAIAAMMTFVNVVSDETQLSISDLNKFLLILAPFAPFITEELWSRIGNKESIHHEPWPNYDETKLVVDSVQIVIQVNGKLRGTIHIDKGQVQDQGIVEKKAKDNQSISKYLNGRIKKVIFVPSKLINFVVG